MWVSDVRLEVLEEFAIACRLHVTDHLLFKASLKFAMVERLRIRESLEFIRQGDSSEAARARLRKHYRKMAADPARKFIHLARRRIAHRGGGPEKLKPGPARANFDINLAIRLRTDGGSLEEVARAVGVSRETLRRRLREVEKR